MTPLLQIDNICKSYRQSGGSLFKKHYKQIIKSVSLTLNQGECLGIVGESGSGKSTLGRLILGLEKSDQGHIYFNGLDIHSNRHNKKNYQQQISAVFQDYNASVNPHFSVAQIIGEPLTINQNQLSSQQKKHRISELLELVGLDESFIHRYPHQMSGGQLQRICIARAIACNPTFILFDEAVSSLDVSIQHQVLSLLADLQKQLNLTSIFITHDLTTVTYLCNRLAFFYQGEIIENVNPISQLGQVNHPYSQQLLQSVLDF